MSAIRKSLLQLMFSGSYMRRWNDKLRPVELYEIDKQAHKMIVAWMLTLLNSGGYSAPDQRKLQQEVIERGPFRLSVPSGHNGHQAPQYFTASVKTRKITKN